MDVGVDRCGDVVEAAEEDDLAVEVVGLEAGAALEALPGRGHRVAGAVDLAWG